MAHVDAAKLTTFVADIFAALGSSRDEATRIGRCLVNANLTGHDSHGVARVPRYVAWKRDGLLIADQVVKRVVDTPVIAILDGQFGFGQTIAPQAVAHRHREMPRERTFGDRPASFRACRTGRRMGRDGGGLRAGLGAFRQCRGLGAGRAVRRRRPAILDRAGLHRHSASGNAARDPRFCDLAGRRRQGAGRKPGRQDAAGRRARICRGRGQRRSARTLRRLRSGVRPRAITRRARARCAPSAITRAPGSR